MLTLANNKGKNEPKNGRHNKLLKFKLLKGKLLKDKLLKRLTPERHTPDERNS